MGLSQKQLNSDGQPLASGLHHARLIGRSADELIGICKGVLADGVLAQSEAEFLLRWMDANKAYIDQWPFSHLYARIAAALSDGKLDQDEEREILAILANTAAPSLGPKGEAAPNELLCDDPAPTIQISGCRICLTGKFVSGKRTDIEALITAVGGQLAASVSRKVDCLVIGSFGSRDWLMSTHGTKIQAAAELKQSGHSIAVIAERIFMPYLGS